MNILSAMLLSSTVLYGIFTGYNGSANIVATPIASRAIKPRRALALAASGVLVGPLVFGEAVARAIATGITDPENVSLPVLIAATLAAVVWLIFTWRRGMPASASHALIGGLAGAIVVSSGPQAIDWGGLAKVGLALFFAPLAGLAAGFILMRVTIYLARGASTNINILFKRSQIFSSYGLALAQGTNDAQKVMGILTLGLLAEGTLTSFVVPMWVVAIGAGANALGTGLGGWRLIRTLGYRIYKVRPVHGFVSQMASAFVIMAASLSGGPVSPTQVISSSIIGAGSAERISKVRWLVGYEMAAVWLITVPVSFVLAAMLYFPLTWMADT